LFNVKTKKYGSYIISLGELEEWGENNQNIPTNQNKPFVVSHKILYGDEAQVEYARS
jgi:hypothetical protein